MKSIPTVCEEFLSYISDNDPLRLAKFANEHQREIPFVQLLVLNAACTAYLGNKDTGCLRALVDNGFQIFICPSDYGTEQVGLDPPVTRLLGDAVTYEPIRDSMVFLDELFSEHFDTYVERHADPSCELSQHWLEILNGYREEISEFIRNPAGFSKYLERNDGFTTDPAPAKKTQKHVPH